ncbi:MAG: 4Fe-4S binding protein [Methanobacteriaceae archaeon]|nr:4Fe-4S binding protein [Methanobacteriaceae archaeon]
MIIFNEEGCIKCGACEGTCPTSAIDVTQKQIIHCDLCNNEPKCAEVCPEGAYKVEDIIVDENADPQPRLVFNPIACTECGKCIDICPPDILKLTHDDKKPVEGFCVMCQKCVNICPVDVIGISDNIKEPKECKIPIKGPIYINNCVGCGTCVDFCPVDAITLDKIGGSIEIDEHKCIKCGVCSQTCPWNAVFISAKEPVKRPKEIQSFTVDEDACIGCNTCIQACPGDFIKSKHSNLTVKLPEICAACGLCEKLCPTDAISLDVKWGEVTPANESGLGWDMDKCEHIGACAIKCPFEAIRVVTNTGMQLPEEIQTNDDPSFVNCIRCGACASVCPNDALTVSPIIKNINGEQVFRDRIKFNPTKCDQCGKCVDVCPYHMLKLKDEGKLPVVGFCTLCGQCINACPEDALYFK